MVRYIHQQTTIKAIELAIYKLALKTVFTAPSPPFSKQDALHPQAPHQTQHPIFHWRVLC